MTDRDIRGIAEQLLQKRKKVWFRDPYNEQIHAEGRALVYEAYYAQKNGDGTIYIEKYRFPG